ncbi:MAG: lecithin retinol acyltransferase family protein [Candidatus Hydrogenedentes bacterium]|nr:lecithin retinol acyltransferase family protein [Candidatus Hydrogenedentota bacterium]
MARGDHIRVRRKGYWHHGIDCGDGTVIHYEGELFHYRDARVRKVTLAEFAKGGTVRVVPETGTYEPDIIIERAESRMDECRYSPLLNNCEHFARWCATGFQESRQVERALYAVSGIVIVAAGSVAAYAVGRALGRGRERGRT